jgi:tetratricopeptide (TPR) repeat protein
MNHRNEGGNGSSATVDFFSGLDAIFASNQAATQAEPYLMKALHQAESRHDEAAALTVLNELMGFLRSQGRHDDNEAIIKQSLLLIKQMHITGTEAWLTTLINAATSLRAAGDYQQSEHLYKQALDASTAIFDTDDRRLAALHNNLSMLYSSTERYAEAELHLKEALHILERSSANPAQDLDIASSHTNLALLLLHLPDRQNEALDEARRAMKIYDQGHLEGRAHYAATLAAYAQALFHNGHVREAIEHYEHSLEVIALHYGKDTEYYRTTKQNLDSVRSIQSPKPPQTRQTEQTPRTSITGLQLSRAYWEQYGKALISERYADYKSRIAVGLVGHGSECYGFDDRYSQDHDFGPGFCLWLTHDDYQEIGERLQQDYLALPQEFMGFASRNSTPRAQGSTRRVGAFDISEFFTSLTGYAQAPAQEQYAAWLMLDEATLAAATNGEIFADPYGAFSRTRQGFTLMPQDVRLSLISRRLGMIAQSGQYNFPRMIARQDGAAAWLCIEQFVAAVSSLIFLINTPVSAGYLPYYKWSFAALRRLSARMASRLPQLTSKLESVLRFASSACFGTHGVHEVHGTRGSAEDDPGTQSALRQVNMDIEEICSAIVAELHVQGLSSSDEHFLEWQRPYVEARIQSEDPCLHSL